MIDISIKELSEPSLQYELLHDVNQYLLLWCFTLWIVAITASEVNQPDSQYEDDYVQIKISRGRSSTQKLHSQVRIEENNASKRSFNIDIHLDPICGAAVPIGSTVFVSKTSPKPFYEFFPGMGHYRFHNRGENWYSAKATCEKEGAHLAIVNSKEELGLLQELYFRLPTLVSHANFIGITDEREEGS